MGFINKLFKKKVEEDPQNTRHLTDDVADLTEEDERDSFVQENPTLPTELGEVGEIATDVEQDQGDFPSEHVSVDINYHGGLLSSNQKSKEEQYQELLAGLTEDTLHKIEQALQEEQDIYEVFSRIEEKGINLLVLVALDLASEEDISVYQVRKQRKAKEVETDEDEDDEEVESFTEFPEEPIMTSPSPFFTETLTDGQVEEDNPTFPAVMEIEEQPEELTFPTLFDAEDIPSFHVLEDVKEPPLEVIPMKGEETPFPSLYEEENPMVTEPPTVEPSPVNETILNLFPSAKPTEVTEEIEYEVESLEKKPSFLDFAEETSMKELEGVEESIHMQTPAIHVQAPTEPSETVDTTSNAIDQLLSLATKLQEVPVQQEKPKQVSSSPIPQISESERAEKIAKLKKYTRADKVRNKRIYYILDDHDQVELEGYDLFPIHSLDQLSDYGLDVNDLLLVGDNIPSEAREELRQFIQNILEDTRPYRVLTLQAQPYLDVELESLDEFTRDCLDTYYQDTPIHRDNKNQLSGFQGFADFISNQK